MKTPQHGLPCACAAARQAARVLTQFYDSRMRSAGLEAPQFTLMMALEEAGPCSQVELGRLFALDKTTVSRNVRLLERNGWIEPVAAGDKRLRRFTLTGDGRKRLAAAKPEWKKAQDQLRAGMTTEQWEAMFQAFRNITEVTRNQAD
uniref:Transcriptional regulator, MarR family n=1 Tax=Solibacter usitatus (strain Ellin6076) TaxID=234267 RepID=Q029B3_SOLUE